MSSFGLRPASGPATTAFPGFADGGRHRDWREILGSGVALLLIWHERARQRHHLRSLSDHMLRDIGLGRADVEGEATKPFWRP